MIHRCKQEVLMIVHGHTSYVHKNKAPLTLEGAQIRCRIKDTGNYVSLLLWSSNICRIF